MSPWQKGKFRPTIVYVAKGLDAATAIRKGRRILRSRFRGMPPYERVAYDPKTGRVTFT